MVIGVSTRKYRRSLEDVPADVVEHGTRKSAVSRRFVAATGKKLEAWMHRDLGALELTVIMIDGLHVDDHVVLVALGFDVTGAKHLLGIHEGATENRESCKALLVLPRDPTDLWPRVFPPRHLFVTTCTTVEPTRTTGVDPAYAGEELGPGDASRGVGVNPAGHRSRLRKGPAGAGCGRPGLVVEAGGGPADGLEQAG